MKLFRVAVLLVLAAGIATSGEAQELTLRGLGGEELREIDLAQGVTVIVVWASWSPRGRDIVDRVNALSDRWSREARVVTVSFQENRSSVEGFLAGRALRAPVFLDSDGSFSKKYAVATLPGLLVFKNGSVAYRGKLPEDPNRLLAEFIR